MAGTVIITKHSLSTGSPATDALSVGELAYSFASDRLFIGETSGSDVVARIIGGQLYTDMMDHTAGTLTASSAIKSEVTASSAMSAVPIEAAVKAAVGEPRSLSLVDVTVSVGLNEFPGVIVIVAIIIVR